MASNYCWSSFDLAVRLFASAQFVFDEYRKLLWRAAISNRGQGGHPITKFGGGYDLSHVLQQLVHEVRRRTRRGEQPDRRNRFVTGQYLIDRRNVRKGG